MIGAAAFCPQPPLLVPEVAAGAAAELDALRAACRTAIRTACAGLRPVLLGPGPVSAVHPATARGSLAGYGVCLDLSLGGAGERTAGDGPALPPALAVGAWLLRDALGPRPDVLGCSVGPDYPGSAVESDLRELAAGHDVALVVLADGSARRSTSAPGYLDARAAGFDAAVAAALRSGEGARLAELDARLGAELLASGVPAWHAAAALLAGRHYAAGLDYDQAPYGVGYFVATWTGR